MTGPPLTHHDILTLVEPFTRRGRQVDLATSDRIKRQLAFKAVDRICEVAELGGLLERLALEQLSPQRFRLTRTLTLASGLQARLVVAGPDPAKLLDQVDAVDTQLHFRVGKGYVMVRHYTLEVDADASVSPAFTAQRVLTGAEVRLDGFHLSMSVPSTRNMSAALVLSAPLGTQLELPHDLLAVLGWNWSPLLTDKQGWSAKLRLRGPTDKRTTRAECALDQVAAHLARTLAQPPSQFHDSHVAARWTVVLRRAIPILTPIVLLVVVVCLSRLNLHEHPGMLVLMYPIIALLILHSFTMQDMARFEIPIWPRRSNAARWHRTVV